MKRLVLATTILALLCPFALAADEAAGERDSLRVFYLASSLTGCSQPEWHGELGASAGKEWVCNYLLARSQLWSHCEELAVDQATVSAGQEGQPTVDPQSIESATFGAKNEFYKPWPWEALLLEASGTPLEQTVTELWGGRVKFDEPTDIGATASAVKIMGLQRKLNPESRFYTHATWPRMPAGEVPPEDQLPEWAQAEGAPVSSGEFPRREDFDYELEWSEVRYSLTDPRGKHNRDCRDYFYQHFEALKERFPDLAEQGRLQMIPTGDVLLALEKKMRAGEFPGVETVNDFYTDNINLRAGLPRYTVAAIFYAVLFDESPEELDWSIYNDPEKYGGDPRHDEGELLQITEERARIVNETVWDVVAGHPHTGIPADQQPAE
jgi:hypothetical protein